MENGDKIKLAKLETKVEYIADQVSNHIPTSIKELDKTNKEEHRLLQVALDKFDLRLDSLEKKLAVWGGIITFAMFVITFLSKFI